MTAAEPAALARVIVATGLNVRQAERLARGSGEETAKVAPAKDVNTAALEADLTAALGLKVNIRSRTVRGQPKGGVVRIAYGTLEQLDEVCRRLCHHTASGP